GDPDVGTDPRPAAAVVDVAAGDQNVEHYRASSTIAGLRVEQARGHERPAIDVPDDLLLAGVVLHDVLPGRIGRIRGQALGGGVAIALAGVAPEPVTENPVLHQLGTVESEDVQIAGRI